MTRFKRIVTAFIFTAIFLSAFFSTADVRMQRIWKWYDHTRLQSDTVTIDSLLVTRFFLLQQLTTAPFDSEGAMFYDKTADPGTLYYHNGVEWLSIGYVTGGGGPAGDSSWHMIQTDAIAPFGADDTIELGLDADDTVRVRGTVEFFEDVAVGTWATGFSQAVWDAIQDSCDSVLHADTVTYAWNAESLGGIVHDDYLGAHFDDTATAELCFADTLRIAEDIFVEWAYPDKYVWAGYTGGTWSLETQNDVDLFIRGDSLVFQTIGEGNNRGISFLDSSGTVIVYFTNDGDLVFNPNNAADIWLVDTIHANVFYGWADSALWADSAGWADSSLFADTASYADSSLWADSTAWADSASHSLNADSLGGTVVLEDVLLSSRIDSTAYPFYFLDETYMKNHVTIDQNKYILFKDINTSYMRFNNSTNQMQFGSKDGIAFHVWAETLLMTSMAEAGPCAIFRDSTGDDVLTIFNEGGITLAKDWQGMGIWSGTNAIETLAVVGISTASIALVSPCNSDNGFMSWDCWADTCTVTRSAALAQDSFGYLIVK